jgi:hypothetical protein
MPTDTPTEWLPNPDWDNVDPASVVWEWTAAGWAIVDFGPEPKPPEPPEPCRMFF